jgi:ribosomal protein S12 methylthiotransferase
MPRVNTLASHSAYIKIAEGCQHRCSFCVIPKIRGPLRSRPIDSVVEEVKGLASAGVVEFNLIAQDLAAYGRDMRDNTTLLELLSKLVKIKGARWFRLLYMYPENISDAFLDFMASEEKIVPYLDIPVQHASDRILLSMARQITSSQLRDILGKVRHKVPSIALRTSVMTGFPGETDAQFDELRAFVKEQKFEHLGCFTYSREEDTIAATLPRQVPEELKKTRAAKIMRLQKSISRRLLTARVGSTVDVLVEGAHEETDLLLKGRMATQAPEVDGHVIINAGTARVGEIVKVRVTESHDYDLVGEIL